jgi:hypothetical protein
MEVPLPAVTVSGGDTVRVAVEFAGGQYFRRIAPPVGGYASLSFELSLQNDPAYPAAVINGVEEGRRMRMFDRNHDLAFESLGISSFYVEIAQKDLWGALFAAREFNYSGEPLVPETGGKLVFEWPIPTELPSHFSIPDPPVFGTRTFSNNTVTLLFGITGPFGWSPGGVAAVAVPEPATLALAVLAVFVSAGLGRFRAIQSTSDR